MIESARGRETAAPFVTEMGRLLRLLTVSVESGVTGEAGVLEIVSRVRRALPSLMVRIVAAGQVPQTCSDSVYFRIPAEGAAMADRLIVEFPRGCALDAWHLQLLEAAAQLITVSKDLGAARDRSTHVDAGVLYSRERQRVEPRGWNRLVVRYRDGRLLKGYGRDFLPARGSVDLWSEPDCLESRLTIPFAHLKAVFFVHDFEGNPAHSVAPDGDDPSLHGRRITVTFVDGEVLRGATLGYSQNAVGFFVSPLDSTSNNAKIFVLAGAIRHVQFDSSNCTPMPQPIASVAR
jgi:hypothetical protein